jgi:hypothetical protein
MRPVRSRARRLHATRRVRWSWTDEIRDALAGKAQEPDELEAEPKAMRDGLRAQHSPANHC